ncbi:MAG: polymerase subunit beta [Clostridia bacterium]|nr:polymerase subunit beta [Clostridia bacterium]
MNINCPQPQLVNAVQKVYRAVASTTTLPALTGILLEAKNDTLTLHGTDLDLGIIHSFPVEVIEKGTLLLPARIFTEMVRRLPPIPINIKSLDNNKVEISYHQSKIELNNIDPNQFPSLPNIEGSFSFEVEANKLKDAIRKVSIATGSEDLQSVFNGILLEIEPEKNYFNLVATDTHRLAVYHNEPLSIANEKPFNALIANRAMNELARLLPNNDNKVNLTINSNQIYIQYESTTLYARLMNGKFPHYRQVIPEKYNTSVKLPTRDLLDTAERATLLAKDEIKTRSHIIFFEVGENKVKVTSEAAEVGNLEEELPANIEGESLKLALNGRYLVETLRIIDDENIDIKMIAPLKPIVVKPQDNDNYFCLILPVRVG